MTRRGFLARLAGAVGVGAIGARVTSLPPAFDPCDLPRYFSMGQAPATHLGGLWLDGAPWSDPMGAILDADLAAHTEATNAMLRDFGGG